MAIYTRTGDKGNTSLFNGQRVSKADLRVEAYGTVDELNSVIGMAVSENQRAKIKEQRSKTKIKNELIQIQNDLLELGSVLANPEGDVEKLATYLKKRVEDFEKLIDEMTTKMPALTSFIIPGGTTLSSSLHIARTICRRAERRMVALTQQKMLDKGLVKYVNRLSDLLFTMARFANYLEKEKEILWSSKNRVNPV